MSHRPLYGHQPIRQRLSQSFNAGSLPASLLLSGPRGVGKQRLGLWLAQLLMCERATSERLAEPCGECVHCRYAMRGQHPDIHWFFPRPKIKDGDVDLDEVKTDLAEAVADRMKKNGLWAPTTGLESLYVATVRALVQMAALRPAMGRRTVFVVGDADRMVPQVGSEQAANAFLKLLEEPPSDTTIIITSSEPGSLLPTIRSRVVSVRVPPMAEPDVRAFFSDSALASYLKGTTIEHAVALANGAPGTLIGSENTALAAANAKRFMDAALMHGGPQGLADRIKVATRQGIAGARGAFTDMLDALTLLLHQHARALTMSGMDRAARRAAQAIAEVELVKEKAQGNVSPQLLSASLISTLHSLLTQ